MVLENQPCSPDKDMSLILTFLFPGPGFSHKGPSSTIHDYSPRHSSEWKFYASFLSPGKKGGLWHVATILSCMLTHQPASLPQPLTLALEKLSPYSHRTEAISNLLASISVFSWNVFLLFIVFVYVFPMSVIFHTTLWGWAYKERKIFGLIRHLYWKYPHKRKVWPV